MVSAIKNGLLNKKGSQIFGISRGTLINKAISINNKIPGNQAILRRDEQRIVTEILTTVAT